MHRSKSSNGQKRSQNVLPGSSALESCAVRTVRLQVLLNHANFFGVLDVSSVLGARVRELYLDAVDHHVLGLLRHGIKEAIAPLELLDLGLAKVDVGVLCVGE